MNDIGKIKEFCLKKDYDGLKKVKLGNLEDIFSSDILSEMDKIVIFMIIIKDYDKQEDFFNDEVSFIFSDVDDNFYNMKEILMKNYLDTYKLLENDFFKKKIKMIFDMETGVDDNFFLNLPSKYSEFLGYYSGKSNDVFKMIFNNKTFRKVLFDESKLGGPYYYNDKQLYENFFVIKSGFGGAINNDRLEYFLNLSDDELYVIAYLQIYNYDELQYFLSSIFDKYYKGDNTYLCREYVKSIWNGIGVNERKILLEWFRDNTIDKMVDKIGIIIKYFNNDRGMVGKVISFIYNYPDMVSCIGSDTLSDRDREILNWLVRIPVLKNKPTNFDNAYISLNKGEIELDNNKKFDNVSPIGTRSGVFFDFSHEVMVIYPNGFIDVRNADKSHDLVIRDYFDSVIDKIDKDLTSVDLASYLASTGSIVVVIEENVAMVYLPYSISYESKKAFMDKMITLGINNSNNVFFAVLQVLEKRNFLDKDGNINVADKVDSYIYNDGDVIGYDELINYLGFIDNKNFKILR